jgi:hypothetical protein
MRQLLSNLASQSNVHGISSLAGDKSGPLKFFWGLAFLGLLTFAVFQLYTIKRRFSMKNFSIKLEKKTIIGLTK